MRLRGGETQARISKDYYVTKGTIGFIARNETWVDVK